MRQTVVGTHEVIFPGGCGNWNKPDIVTGQYNSRAGISNVEKSRTKLYFLVGVAS